MRITVEGKEIEAKNSQSVLEAALEAGVYIPHLCKHPDLEAAGGCRLCCVEIEGVDGVVPACKTDVKDGMKVSVNSLAADKVRKMAMELILATHPSDCTGCPKYGKCELQSMYQYLGVSAERWRKKARTVATDSSNPLIQHLFTRCIRCGRCIRACRELRGVKVLDYQRQADGSVRVGVDGHKSLKEAGCRFCGACIEVCPTGSIMDAVGVFQEERGYADNVVPCRSSCPAGIDIPEYIRHLKNGEFGKATAVIREKVPFPETLGSICNHKCEAECKRNQLGEPISICRLKRAAAAEDEGEWKRNRVKTAPTGKKIAIVGSGPAGLTAAYYLARKGHAVTVFEENEKAGGQCRYGIPAYRLPEQRLDLEIEDILEVGVELCTGTRVTAPKELLGKGYNAVLLAVGTHKGTKLKMDGSSLSEVYMSTEFLKSAREEGGKKLEGNVMVLGGGNVAYDCARTAIRLGAKEVHIACLESLEHMTASEEEKEEGREEGIILHSGYSFKRILGSEKVEGMELQKIDRFYFDNNHNPVVELIEDSNEIIPVEHIIFAVGQKPLGTELMGIELTNGNYIKVSELLETSTEGIYATGDVVTGTKTVIEAIAGGRKSAEVIDRYLGGDGDIAENLIEKGVLNPYIGEGVGFADLRRVQPKLKEARQRINDFEPYEEVYTEESVQCEAGRCLQCDLRLQFQKPKLWNEYKNI